MIECSSTPASSLSGSLRRARCSASLLAALALAGCGGDNAASPPASAQQPLHPERYSGVTSQSGIDFPAGCSSGSSTTLLDTIGHGVGVLDFNRDGLYDLVIAGHNQVRTYRNRGEFRFEQVDLGLREKGLWGGAAVGDVDNNGWPDLYLTGYDCSALYLNRGGRFEEVTAKAGLQPEPRAAYPDWGTSAGFADLDNDGRVDLVVCRYLDFGPDSPRRCPSHREEINVVCAPKVYAPQHPVVFRNVGGGRFEDVTERWRILGHGNALGVAFEDIDDDGDTDIAVANDERPGDLFRNDGGRFTEIGGSSATAFDSRGQVHGGMGIDWGDVNNDLLPDLFVTTFFLEDKNLYRNLGHGVFEDVGHRWGVNTVMRRDVGFGARLVDWNNDGRLDLAVANGHIQENADLLRPTEAYRQPMRLLQNNGDRFSPISTPTGELMVGRALASADFDNDGGVDLIVTNLEGQPLMLRNVGARGNWFGLLLRGRQSNSMGLGARVWVTSAGAERRFYVTNSGSYMSAHDPRVHVGLGDATASQVRITWPSGIQTLLRDPPAGEWIEVSEDPTG